VQQHNYDSVVHYTYLSSYVAHNSTSQEVVNPKALNETLQERLWEFSEDLVKNYL